MARLDATRLDAALWSVDDLAQLRTLSDVLGLIEDERTPIVVETVIGEDVEPLEAISGRLSRMTTDLRRSPTLNLLRVLDDRGTFVLMSWPTGYPGVFHIAGTIPTTDPRWRKVERWISSTRAVSSVFLNHTDFEDIGVSLREFGDVEVSRLTARKRSDLSSLNRGWPARDGSLRPSPEVAIADAETEGASVRSLGVTVEGAITLHLRRLAGATYYSGDFGIFESVVLSRLAAAASSRRTLLSDRARDVTKANAPRPISIRLPEPVLVDADATGDVIDVLQRSPGLALAVLHRNPYLHVVVSDHEDGSNFDVCVTTTSEIEVYPGFRSTLPALSRLVQRLSQRFDAAEVAEPEAPVRVSLDDLIKA